MLPFSFLAISVTFVNIAAKSNFVPGTGCGGMTPVRTIGPSHNFDPKRDKISCAIIEVRDIYLEYLETLRSPSVPGKPGALNPQL